MAEAKKKIFFIVSAMTQPLPFASFQWVTHPEEIDVLELDDEDPYGYILEVDLIYPQSLHDSHKDLPFCPEHERLMTRLTDNKNYVIHYRTSKQALDNGLVLTKIHKAIRFEQKAWLKPYVEYNTLKRMQAKNKFEKNFYKLIINSVYGKRWKSKKAL